MCFKSIDLIFIACLWIFALIIRIKLFPIESADYYGFLEQWMDEIRSLGGFKSLGTEISNYSTPYMFLMCLVSGCDNSLYALKSISVVFDYVGCVAVFLIVYELSASTFNATLGMAAYLLCPTFFIDSAYWCQCDTIYTAFILLALLFFYKGKSFPCMIFTGVAFGFKLQTLFILPFFVIMYLKKKNINLIDFVFIPLVYLIMQLPAVIFGRPLKDLCLIYFDQSNYYPWGTLQYPNIYALLDETIESTHHMDEITGAGTFMAIILMGFLAYYICRKNIKITTDISVATALFSVALCVYSLPHMHDRYGILIDMLAIIYAVLRPKKLPVAIGFMLISLLTFMPYLIAVSIFDIRTLAVGQLVLIVYVGYDLYKLITAQESIQATI